MTSLSIRGSSDEIAELRNEIEKLKAAQPSVPTGARQRSWRRAAAIAGISVLALGMLAGVAGASGSTTNVSFIALTPAKTVLSNVSITTKKTNSPVVIGGTTTVPSNATTVELKVTAKGATSAGTLDFYPTDNPTAGSGQTLSYPTGTSGITSTIQENVGQSGELTIYNAGSGTATVTATIIGYSTQVSAGDVSGLGGTSGQVLTNDGAGGASWQSLPTGPGSDPAVGELQNSVVVGTTISTVVEQVYLPTGSYHVVVTWGGNSTTPALEDCFLRSPSYGEGPMAYANLDLLNAGDNTYDGSGTAQMLTTTGASGGSVALICGTTGNPGGSTINGAYMIATPVPSATGLVIR